jgi:hypothetical protein
MGTLVSDVMVNPLFEAKAHPTVHANAPEEKHV